MNKEEAIKIIRSHYPANKQMLNEALEFLIPELKEKTDEEIRQQLIAVVHLYYGEGPDAERDECLEWLEKQRNNNPIERKEFTSIPFGAFDSELIEQMFTIPDGYVATIEGNRIHIKRKGKSAIEASKEEKIDNANKIEPKFKVGDIVQYITDSTDRRKIKEVDTLCNMYHTDSSPIMFEIEDEWKVVVNAEDVEQNPTDESIKAEPNLKIDDYVVRKDGKNFHDNRNFARITKIDRSMCQFDNGRWLYDYEIRTWSISDAQDGDILASSSNKPFIYNGNFNEWNVGAYCGINIYDEFTIANRECNWCCNRNIKPATKEQRKSLFDEINLLNYVWNPKTKELNRLDKNEENNN